MTPMMRAKRASDGHEFRWIGCATGSPVCSVQYAAASAAVSSPRIQAGSTVAIACSRTACDSRPSFSSCRWLCTEPRRAILPICHSLGSNHVSSSATRLRAVPSQRGVSVSPRIPVAASSNSGMIRRSAAVRARSSSLFRSLRRVRNGTTTEPRVEPTNPIAAPTIAAVPLSMARTLLAVSR